MPIVLILFFICGFAEASLVSKYQFLNAASLPKNVWLFGVSHSQSKASGNFNGSGSRVSNTNYFSRDLNYSHILDEVNDPLERDLAEAAFSAYDRDANELAGRVVNDITVNQKSNTYILGRGLSEKSGLFLVFPIVTLQTRFKSRFVANDSLNSLARELQKDGQLSRANEILQKSESALRQRLDENGYNNSYPTELTTLANIYVNYRYQALKKDSIKVASDSFVVIPAGKNFSENDFLPIRVNEEQYSFKQALTAEWNPHVLTSLLGSVYYHKRFAFNKAQRIPVNSVSPLSQDIDPSTKIQYGDTWGTSAQVNLISSESLGFYVGQSLEYKLQDQYKGSRFSSKRYDYLEQDTDQQLGIGYLGVNINTIPAFLAKKFPIPVDLNLQYSATNLGKNAFQNKMVSLNMMVFYQ